MTGIIWMVGFNIILTIILLLFMTKYPKYIMFAYNRFLVMKYGISKKKVKSENYSFSYMERGSHSSPTLLLVHGYSSSKESFFNIFKHLPQKYHVIAVDLPGHGETRMKSAEVGILFFVKALNEFVEAMGIHKKKFHLVGTSLGGHIVGVYAARHPQYIHSLCMVCPHGIDHYLQNEIIKEAKRTQKFKLLPQTIEELKEMFEWLTYKQVNIPDIFLTGILHIRLEKNEFYRQLGEALTEPENHNMLERELDKIHSPVLLVWGKEDNILHVDCTNVIKKKLPKPPVKTVILEEVGHGVVLERPRKFIFVLMDFLNSLEKLEQ